MRLIRPYATWSSWFMYLSLRVNLGWECGTNNRAYSSELEGVKGRLIGLYATCLDG
jgi:hypothetical protein